MLFKLDLLNNDDDDGDDEDDDDKPMSPLFKM